MDSFIIERGVNMSEKADKEATFIADGIEWRKHGESASICRPHPCDPTGEALLLARWDTEGFIALGALIKGRWDLIGFERFDSAKDICAALRALVGPPPLEVVT